MPTSRDPWTSERRRPQKEVLREGGRSQVQGGRRSRCSPWRHGADPTPPSSPLPLGLLVSTRLCLLRGVAFHLAAQSSPIKPFKAPRPSSSLPPKSLPKFQAAELSAPSIRLSAEQFSRNHQHCTSSPLCQFRSAAEQSPQSEFSSSRIAPAHNDGLYPNIILYWSPALRAVHRHPAHHAGAHQLGRVG